MDDWLDANPALKAKHIPHEGWNTVSDYIDEYNNKEYITVYVAEEIGYPKAKLKQMKKELDAYSEDLQGWFD